jgi:hypothetical protein
MSFRITLALFTCCFVTPAFAEETLKATVVEQPQTEAKPAIAQAPSGVGFTNTSCTQGKNTRVVELTSGSPETKLPCEVHYKKTTEQAGHDQILWQSANNLSYCESKAQAFVEKLKGWGWSCQAQ